MADAYTIARPYAEAIFELAQSGGTFSEWEESLTLLAAIAEDPSMQRVLGNPKVGRKRQEEVFHSVAGDRLDQGARRLLDALFTNDRVTFLPDILEIYQDLRRGAEGEVHAEVTAAAPLDEEAEKAIASQLEKRFGKKVSVESRVDESLMAGIVIRAGDMVIDGSVRGGLEQLRNQLKA
ncbi:F0F1 ATP synthase subunit delta [Thiohalorhabdus methylotrophus]|uniref:ATP synthase subunit delta n=1 Tax=Thiohalorhabdus methylotrophus TaxID=3242694 RepID=A0ABV4TRK5_9GAMM